MTLKNAFIKKALDGYSNYGRGRSSKSRRRTNTLGQKKIRHKLKQELKEGADNIEKENDLQ
jgi:hypothetical protein